MATNPLAAPLPGQAAGAPQRELAELEELDALERQKRKADAAAYAGGQDVSGMNPIMRGLGGAKQQWDQAALGLKGLVTDLSPEDQQQLQQGRAFNKEAGFASKVGGLGANAAIMAAPGTAGMRVLRLTGEALPAAAGAVVANPYVGASATGAALGAATSPGERTQGAVGGGLGGAAGQGVGQVLTKALSGPLAGQVSQDAREMMNQGVNVPMWKALDSGGGVSGILRSTLERAKGMVGVGPLMKAQEAGAMADYNRTLVRGATPPTPVRDAANGVLRWETSKPVERIGQDGMAELHNRFKQAYDAIYEGRTFPIDDAFEAQLHGVNAAVERYMPGAAPEVQGTLRKVNDLLREGTQPTRVSSGLLDAQGNPIVSNVPGHAGVTNGNVNRALDAADDAVSNAWRAGDAEKARALEDIRDAIQGLRQRGLPPEVQSALEPVNKAYANYKVLQRASAQIGAVRNEGVVTPLQMTSAVKASDRSANKVATTEGRALGQQDAQRAQRVLGSELPEVGPGTAEKTALLSLAAGGGWMAPTTTAATMAAISRPGQRALMGGYPWQGTLRDNPFALADALRSTTTPVGTRQRTQQEEY